MSPFRAAPTTASPARDTRAAGAPLFLSTGAALLVYVLAGVSLLYALGVALLLAAVAGAWLWRRAGATGRPHLRRLVRVGVVSGLAATAAYDLSRFALIELTGIAFWPFDVFLVFGRALLGAEAAGFWVEAAGLLYHVLNGVCFAVAYTLLWGERGVLAGLAWALALEGLMVSVYPGWLGLKALGEFLQVSVFGHLVYGAVLGWTARRMLTGSRGGRHALG
jgi:hypothetical protein